MAQEIARILNLVVAMLIIAAVWAVATMRISEPPKVHASHAITRIQNEKSNA
ncbi:hypothetical protein [Brevundimonas sp. PWP3-1b1]|uniref:hypothetical protein n=1 Tax=unclassified Brevundimonas TaxID=2622653 RepID=UPI003CFB7419